MNISRQFLTMVANILKEKGWDKGQALFEFIIFLPFLLFVLTTMFAVGNAINGSINQQKAVRRYFFYIYKGNSTIPTAENLDFLASSGLQKVGAVSVGWKEKTLEQGETGKAIATCYPFSTLFGKSDDDDCENPSIEEGRSGFIRIYTQFGLCGETYSTFGNNTFSPDYFRRSLADGCTLQ